MIVGTEDQPATRRAAGSFRDPSGYVFHRGDRTFRAIDYRTFDLLCSLDKAGRFAQLVNDGLIVATDFVKAPDLSGDLREENPGYDHFLEHETLSPITYPYEWSISMLADAAKHTIDLQLQLLADGFSLKDATAYNIQFVSGRTTFIDISSIERPQRLDLWYALDQFNRMFTFPLILCRNYGWDLRSYFLASLNGRSVEQVAGSLNWFQRLNPRLLLDVTLPLLLSRRAERRNTIPAKNHTRPAGNSSAQQLNLKRLRSKVIRLSESYRPQGVWADYATQCHYVATAEADKKKQVREFIETERPELVLDLGCNSGDYSFLAAECGARVIAVDNDHDAIELLYRRLRQTEAPITPMVNDLSNPSPGIGFRNEERTSFLDRIDADCVLALALVHHLIVSGNLSLEAIRDQFFDLTRQDLVVEFVPPGDPMFERLTKNRADSFSHLTLDLFRETFLERFRLLREVSITDSIRTLLFFRKET